MAPSRTPWSCSRPSSDTTRRRARSTRASGRSGRGSSSRPASRPTSPSSARPSTERSPSGELAAAADLIRVVGFSLLMRESAAEGAAFLRSSAARLAGPRAAGPALEVAAELTAAEGLRGPSRGRGQCLRRDPGASRAAPRPARRRDPRGAGPGDDRSPWRGDRPAGACRAGRDRGLVRTGRVPGRARRGRVLGRAARAGDRGIDGRVGRATAARQCPAHAGHHPGLGTARAGPGTGRSTSQPSRRRAWSERPSSSKGIRLLGRRRPERLRPLLRRRRQAVAAIQPAAVARLSLGRRGRSTQARPTETRSDSSDGALDATAEIGFEALAVRVRRSLRLAGARGPPARRDAAGTADSG